MSNKSRRLNLPLKNIASILNSSKMTSFSSDSSFVNLSNSPMSSLTYNLSELSTGRSTPRRRLSLSSLDSPPNSICDKQNSENIFSAESGCFSESSSLEDSPTLESLKRFTTDLYPEIPLEAFSVKKRTIAFRRISSEPLPSLRLDSPTDFLDEDKDESNDSQPSQPDLYNDETNSQDSGLGFDHDQRLSICSDDGASTCSSSASQLERLPSLDEVWNLVHPESFKEPRGKPPKRTRSFLEHKGDHEDTCSPLKYSPVKASSLPRPTFSGFSKSLFSETISETPTQKEPPKQKKKLSFDDGFQELFDMEDVNSNSNSNESDQVSSLLSATLLHHPKSKLGGEKPRNVLFKTRNTSGSCDDQDGTPSSRHAVGRRTLLQRSQSLQVRSSYKRCEPPQDITPVQSKRLRGNNVSPYLESFKKNSENIDITAQAPASSRRFHRCHSETEAMIKSAVSRMYTEPDLIGDSSRPYCLPTTIGKHQDLKSITPETLSRVMANEFSDEIEEFHIIDCRYPYEYEGGHIENGLNLYTKDSIIDKYLKTPITTKDSSKRLVLIFHCEFSSERGPGLARFLRKLDRETNKECYPFLHYPEIYLLEGGYKKFFEHNSDLCEPKRYLTMLDKNHSEDLRKFRAKCKSWSDDRSNPRQGLRTLKF